MYTLIIFLVFSLIEYFYIRSKISDVNEYMRVASTGAKLTGADGYSLYKKSILFLSRILILFKNVLVIPIILLILINIVVAGILGSIISIFV